MNHQNQIDASGDTQVSTAQAKAAVAPTWKQLQALAIKHGCWTPGYGPFAAELLATYGLAPEEQPHWVAEWLSAERYMREQAAAAGRKSKEPASSQVSGPDYDLVKAMEAAWHEVSQDSSITCEAKWHRFYRKVFAGGAPESALSAALNEADRRAGAAERSLAACQADLKRLERVREAMKAQWGADRRVSFDVVWAEALALKAIASGLPKSNHDRSAVTRVGPSELPLSQSQEHLPGGRDA